MPGRSGSAPCGPSPFHGDRQPRHTRAAAAGRRQSPPPRSAVGRCDPSQTAAATDGRARHGSVLPSRPQPPPRRSALGSGNRKSMPRSGVGQNVFMVANSLMVLRAGFPGRSGPAAGWRPLSWLATTATKHTCSAPVPRRCRITAQPARPDNPGCSRIDPRTRSR